MGLQFITKRGRPTGATIVESSTTMPSPTTIEGLHASDIVLTFSGLGLNILTSGQIAVHIVLNKISNWAISNNKVFVYSEDETPLELSFLSNIEATNGLAIITNGINNL